MLHWCFLNTAVQVRLANSLYFGVGAEPGDVVSGSLPSRAGIRKQRNSMESRNGIFLHKCIKQRRWQSRGLEMKCEELNNWWHEAGNVSRRK